MSHRILRGLPIAESALHTRRSILSKGIQKSTHVRRINNTIACLPQNLTNIQSGIQDAKTKDFAPVSPKDSKGSPKSSRSPSVTYKACRRWILPIREPEMDRQDSYQFLA